MATSSSTYRRWDGADALVDSLRRAGLDVRPLPRAEPSTAAALSSAVARPHGPMVFPGLTDGWPARKKWTPQALVEAHGQVRVQALMDLPSQGVLLPKEQSAYEQELSFGEFVTGMLDASPSSPCYLAYTRPEGLFPEGDYDFSSLTGGPEGETDTRVWVGSGGTRSALHSDLKDNLFCQIWGEKFVVLVPWEYSGSVYPFPDNLVNSQIDLAELDLHRFPQLRSAVLYAGALTPGDVLFMPRGCWHDFSSLTPSISINHWFGPSVEFKDYISLLMRLGPSYWAATAKDFLVHGILRKPEPTHFFFSPPSTGKRLYNLLRWGNFSRENDPTRD